MQTSLYLSDIVPVSDDKIKNALLKENVENVKEAEKKAKEAEELRVKKAKEAKELSVKKAKEAEELRVKKEKDAKKLLDTEKNDKKKRILENTRKIKADAIIVEKISKFAPDEIERIHKDVNILNDNTKNLKEAKTKIDDIRNNEVSLKENIASKKKELKKDPNNLEILNTIKGHEADLIENKNSQTKIMENFKDSKVSTDLLKKPSEPIGPITIIIIVILGIIAIVLQILTIYIIMFLITLIPAGINEYRIGKFSLNRMLKNAALGPVFTYRFIRS